MKRRILCLYLPNWPIQRVLGERNVGQVSNLPVLLHARDPRRGQLVVAASESLLAHGVRLGMPLAEAAGTLRLPSAGNGTRSVPITLPHDPAADLAELARLAEHCERFSPLVGWETAEAARGQRSEVGQAGRVHESALADEMHQPDGLFLDVTGIGVLFGGEEWLVGEVVADMARLGYTAHVAVADTIGAAWAGASQRARGQEPEWVQGSGFRVQEETRNAELGARSEKADVTAVLSTQYLVPGTSSPVPSPQPLAPFRVPSSTLRALPLESLRLPAETLDLLAQLGLKQLGDLLALPRASLRARFGERLLLRLDQLTGAAQETIVPYRPPPKFAAEWVLEYPAERQDVIGQILRELVGRVAVQLAERREGVVELHCRLDCAPGNPVRMSIGLFRPSADARHLWDLVRMQLEQTRLLGAVGRITVQAGITATLENRQGQLFAGGRDEADRQLALFIDRVTSRLGPEAVLRPQLTADPLPERAVGRMRNAECGMRNKKRIQVSGFRVQDKNSARHSALRIPHSALHRPLFLRQPLPLDAVSVVPDGPPITFRHEGQLHRVLAHWGPERIESGWFRGQSVRRDYYRVLTTAGLRFWLFRRLDDGKWHLHGEFS
jgi:protein ImuB